MRDRLSRLKRKTKSYSKSQYMLEISVRLWSYFKDIFSNIDKFIKFKTEVFVNECWMIPYEPP